MKLSNLANVLRAEGLSVVETPGWANRGFAGQDLREVRGVLWHHTATNRARFEAADAPTLSMCLNGRPDLPGPLCQIVFGRSGTVYLLAAGVANHAGAGVAPGIPRDQGNHYLIGVEMESSGVAPWDWTPAQIRVAPHLGAGLERACLMHLPAAERYQGAHYEYSSQGKIDPAGWPGGMDGLRASINAVLNGSAAIAPQGAPTTVQEDDMAAVPQDQWNLLMKIAGALSDNAATKKDLEGARVSLIENGQAMHDVTRNHLINTLGKSPANIAESLDAAGLAASVRDELVKLLAK